MIFASDITSAVSKEECERLADVAKGTRALEIGAEYGRSTIALASTAKVVHSVDWHRGDMMSGFKDSLPEFLANLIRYNVRDKVVVHLGRIQDVAPILRPSAFDVVFIDGDHSYESVRRDVALAAYVLRDGGALLAHDGDQEQVRRAVMEHAALVARAAMNGAGTLLEVSS